MGLNDLEDVPVQRSSGFFHASLSTRLAERLAWEACRQDVACRDVHGAVVRMLCDVVEGVDAPVQFVDRCRMLVDFRREYAFASEIAKCRVEPADSGKEVNECKWHTVNLHLRCSTRPVESFQKRATCGAAL